jgi:hypothetical protein
MVTVLTYLTYLHLLLEILKLQGVGTRMYIYLLVETRRRRNKISSEHYNKAVNVRYFKELYKNDYIIYPI